MTATLDLGLVGNGSFSVLVDANARVVWGCLPAFDGDPAFCALLSPVDGGGDWDVLLEDFAGSEQAYVGHSAVLRTVLRDVHGGAVEVTDFAPRWRQFGRSYRPVTLVRRLRPLAGAPRERVRVRPLADWGARAPEPAWGSHHLRWALAGFTARLTTDAPLRLLREGEPFLLDGPLHFVLGPDEPLERPVDRFVAETERRTLDYWRDWVRSLSLPLEWQDAVIRSAITLKLSQYEDTGALIAAPTTSIPESADSGRNWDYRYCWLRDAAFVVRALNRLNATRTMEKYLRYLANVVARDGADLQPVYGIGFERELVEHHADALRGYRGMGPVRRGNAAYTQRQHDSHGSVLLAASHLFFDERLAADPALFARFEPLGERAYALHDQPDAGLGEFRGREEVHTHSAVLCWAACDRLAKIAARLGRDAPVWRERADRIRATVLERAFDETLGHFVDTFGGKHLDASLLLLHELGFVEARDPRFVATVEAIGRTLRRGDGLYRYRRPDDFGTPDTSFTICTFWYVEALAAIGREAEARELFERVLARRNPLGLLSEDLAFEGGEAWGNFPQTYSHVGLVMAAMRLSRPWQDAT